jgi:hypothetical protein
LWPKTLAWLGAEGWELVGVAASPDGDQELWFKRPLAKASVGRKATVVRSY